MRTSALLVGGIVKITAGADLTPFMEVANELVTEKCINSSYSDERLIKIETWLAAHFYTCSLKRQYTQANVGGVSVGYQSRIDLGFNLTHYGQMAMQLDTAGNLAALNQAIINGKRQIVGLKWLGTDREVSDE